MEVEELVRSVDIVEYISQFVDLEQRGDEFWGLSCFKQENTPSFSVRPDPPFFYDYSSGKGGNIITFIKEYFHCSSAEAVEKLKNYAGIEGDLTPSHAKLSATVSCKKFTKRSNTKKAESITKLPENYMTKYLKTDSKLKVWEDEGISRASLDKFQVYYDPFANRLVYPVRNLDGTIVNIGSRTLNKDWKARGEHKYGYYFPFGSINTIYGVSDNINDIKKKHEIILFEGCKSVLLADTWNIHNCGAILTSHLSTNQLKILAKLGCDVVFALDKDVNILEDKNITKLKQFVKVFYIHDKNGLLNDKDSPVDKGEDVFKRLYNSKIRLR